MVLNSLTSSGMVGASLSVMGIGGSLIELSKRDIWSHGRVEMERSDVSHQLLAMDFLPKDMQRLMLEKVAGGVGGGRIAALPGVVHSMEAVQSALRQMSQVSERLPC
jgi:hypothetical protein